MQGDACAKIRRSDVFVVDAPLLQSVKLGTSKGHKSLFRIFPEITILDSYAVN